MIVIGAGRVGSSLKRRSAEHGIEIELLTRTEGWEGLEFAVPGDPIVVATRNDDLLGVLERVPDFLHADLVFIQNGWVRGLIRNNGLGNMTRGLIYFAARERDGEIEPGGINWFCGPHALAMVRWFSRMRLKARAVDWARFSYYELEKLTWICTLGPLCEKYDCTVGEVVEQHSDELKALAAEFQLFGRQAFSVHAEVDYLHGKLVDYSRSIPGYRAGVKEWSWRNGAVLDVAIERGFAMPQLLQLLIDTGHEAELPPALR